MKIFYVLDPNTFMSFTLKHIFDLLIPIFLSISSNLLNSLKCLNKSPCFYAKFRILLYLHLIMLSNSFSIGTTSLQFLTLSHLISILHFQESLHQSMI